jgi:hypothetical protein
MARRKSPCPLCGSYRSLPVIYGTPLPDDVARAEAGLLVLGGMNVHPGAPDRWCTECQSGWRAPVGKSAAPT